MKPTDAEIFAAFERHDNARAAKGSMDTVGAILAAAAELGLTYAQVRDVVVRRFSGMWG